MATSAFPTPEAKTDFYRELARRANDGRIVLSRDDAEALVSAYELLQRIAHRARGEPVPGDEPPDAAQKAAAGGKPAAKREGGR